MNKTKKSLSCNLCFFSFVFEFLQTLVDDFSRDFPFISQRVIYFDQSRNNLAREFRSKVKIKARLHLRIRKAISPRAPPLPPPNPFACSSPDISTGAITCRPNFSSALDAPPNLRCHPRRRKENRSLDEAIVRGARFRGSALCILHLADRRSRKRFAVRSFAPSMKHRQIS